MVPLQVRCDDAYFAPKQESVEVHYQVPGGYAVRELWIEVHDRDGAQVLNEQIGDLGGGQSTAWNGHLAEERWAHPLGSPYRIILKAELEALAEDPSFSSAESRKGPIQPCIYDQLLQQPLVEQPIFGDHAEVKVLHHSIVLLRCPWEERYLGAGWGDDAKLAAKLNQKGYHAGVPGAATREAGSPLMRALRRFHFNHPTEQQKPFAADTLAGLVDAAPALFPVLVNQQAASIAEGAEIPEGPMRLHVEAIGFEADFDQKNETEFEEQYGNRGDVQRWALEAARMNRPLLPILAKIYIKAKANGGERADVPEAVGPVKVLWRVTEPDADASEAPDDWSQHSRPQTFLKRVYAAGKEAVGSTNCPVDHCGVRTLATPWQGLFRPGTAVHGFDLAAADAKLGMANLASVDSERADVLGTSCVYFNPSWIAGDRYQIEASLAYDAEDLAQDNGAIARRTGEVTVWRRVRLAAIVGWPPRNGGYAAVVQHLKTHFARAFVDIDDSAALFPRASQVIDANDFREIIQQTLSLTGFDEPLLTSVISDAISDDGIFALRPEEEWAVTEEAVKRTFGKDATDQRRPLGELEEALAHEQPMTQTEQQALQRLWSVVEKMLSMTVLRPREEPIPALISRKIRRGLNAMGGYRVGVVLLDYRMMDLPYKSLLRLMDEVTTLSEGNHDLFALVDQRYMGGASYVLTHEIGHCFMLRHHENAGRGQSVDDQQRDHDLDDHGCMMSYVRDADAPCWPHQEQGHYSAAFCGKCLLKLRGWDVHRDGALRPPVKKMRILGLYDQADPGLGGAAETSMIAQEAAGIPVVQVRVCAFNKNAEIAKWKKLVEAADVYHHIAHGNQYCKDHKCRAASLWLFEPKYMLACADRKNAELLQDAEGELHGSLVGDEIAGRDKLGAMEKFYKAKYNLADGFFSYDHPLEGVFQWVVDDDDSSADVMFHPEDVKRSLLSMKQVPVLAFLSSCLTGWNGALPLAFLEGGVSCVIAFRGRYNPGGQFMFPSLFYKEWAKVGMDPAGIEAAFRRAAMRYPGAEPTLFTQGGWIRAVCQVGESAFRRAFNADQGHAPDDVDVLIGLEVVFVEGKPKDSMNLKSTFFTPFFSTF